MSFDPSSSLVRICSEGITGKDAHAIGFSVVYGHEKWETNAWNLTYGTETGKISL